LADLIAAAVTSERAVTGGTHESQARSWRRFQEYLDSIGLGHDYYLDSFTRPQQHKIMCAFAMAMREARFSGPAYDKLAEGTIQGTISNVCSTFRDSGRLNPTKDDDGQLSFILSRLFRAFRNVDPNEVQQKAIPPCVILAKARLNHSEFQLAVGQLVRLGFFFAMRSREYLKVPKAEGGWTKILVLKNLRFIRNGRVMSHDNIELELADRLAITFEMQKKDDKNDTIHHEATRDQTMCPIQAAAELCVELEATRTQTTIPPSRQY
jgi:hypothetical protein